MRTKLLTVFLLLLVVTGCVLSNDHTGVENRWRDPVLTPFEAGRTTQSDVLDVLGPPSQLIRLDNGMVFYYLREETDERTMILLLLNWTSASTRYDRAIFFFDAGGVLTDFATSPESLDYDAE